MRHSYPVSGLPLRPLKEHHEFIPILRSFLTDSPPTKGKVGHTTGIYIPYSIRTAGLKINRKPVNQQLVVSNIWLLKMTLSSQTRLVKISVLEDHLMCVSFLHKIVFFLEEVFVLKDMLTA